MGTKRGTVRLIGGEFGGRKLHFQDKGGEGGVRSAAVEEAKPHSLLAMLLFGEREKLI